MAVGSIIVVAFFVAMIIVSGASAATTIGTNVSTGTVTTTGTVTAGGAVTVTSTTNPQLTVQYDSGNYFTAGASSAGAVTLNAYGGSSANFTFSDDIVIATTTTTQLKTGYNSTNYLTFQTGSGGTTTLDAVGGATASLLAVDPFRIATSSASALEVQNANSSYTTLQVNANSGFVGVGTNGPSYAMHVATTTANQLAVGYNSTNYLTVGVGSGGTTTLDVIGGQFASLASNDPFRIATSSAYAFEVKNVVNPAGVTGSTTFKVDTANYRVGIGTSTPSALLSVGGDQLNGGNVGSATTTIDFGKVCFRSITDAGATIYWWFTAGLNGSAQINLATSTTSCF